MVETRQGNVAILERARTVMTQHDPSVTVSLDGGSLKVDSIIPVEAVLRLLRGANIGVVADKRSERSEFCDATEGRAPQRSRRAAPTATA